MTSPTTTTCGSPQPCTRSISPVDTPLPSVIPAWDRLSSLSGQAGKPDLLGRRLWRLNAVNPFILQALPPHSAGDRQMQQRQQDLVVPDQLDPLRRGSLEDVDARAVLRLLVEVNGDETVQ